MLRIACLTVAALLIALASAQGMGIATRTSGGSVVTELSPSIKVNDGSSLQRGWITINDPASPVTLTRTGANTRYFSSGGGYYSYVAQGQMTTKAAVSAYNIRFALFDVFGNHMGNLSNLEVRDLRSGETVDLDGRWRVSEHDVSRLYTVVSFVSHVRTADGRVWRYSPAAIVETLHTIQFEIAPGVLEFDSSD
jgi:hypothetical protein